MPLKILSFSCADDEGLSIGFAAWRDAIDTPNQIDPRSNFWNPVQPGM